MIIKSLFSFPISSKTNNLLFKHDTDPWHNIVSDTKYINTTAKISSILEAVTDASVAGKTINANSFLEIHWIRVNTAVSSDTYYDIAQVQLEYGRGATPFEQRSYSEELALCQRYCVSYGGDDEVHLGTGHAYNSTNFNVSLHLPVPMRSKPSGSRVNNGAGNWVQVYVGATGVQSDPSITIGDSGGTCKDLHSLRMYLPSSHSGRTAGQAAWVHTLVDAKLILDAELPSAYSP